MTARRQEIKDRWIDFARIAWVSALAASAFLASIALASTSERLVVDRHTGLALGGVDPVAYFTDKQMLSGRSDVELSANGAIWRFRNADNRTFFQAHPEVYAPQFGGYDPVDVARGVAVAGLPRLWVIRDRRLYLFAREESLAAFTANPGKVLGAANDGWLDLRETLAQ